nr:MAG TPA: hypothetical protein [Caudoviricetes sp.]
MEIFPTPIIFFYFSLYSLLLFELTENFRYNIGEYYYHGDAECHIF